MGLSLLEKFALLDMARGMQQVGLWSPRSTPTLQSAGLGTPFTTPF